MASIPPVAHFIWFGRNLLWVHLLAIRSAALRGGFERLVLHHTDDLSDSPWWAELRAVPRLEVRRLAPESLLARCPQGNELVRVFRELEEPAGKANVVRAALLFLEGGTFLDTDTVTLATFQPLLQPGGAFCGQERINRPYAIRVNRSWAVQLPALLRRLLRSTLRELPGGWRMFRRLERLYPAAVNNAVLGTEAGHPFIADLLGRMMAQPPERLRVRYALGTHLLQQAVAEYAGQDLRILPPAAFYPLGPEISIHWFRHTRRARLAEVLQPETRLVHWYASVRTRDILPAINPDYVRARAGTQLFSALAAPFVDG